MLRKELVGDAHSNWEEPIDSLLFAYRSSIHSSTKESPYYIVHGRDPNITINEFLNAAPRTDKSPSNYVGGLANRLRYSFQRVAEESAKARERQREQYNKRAKEFNDKVDVRVLLDIRVVKTGDSRKLTSKYRGPFRIIKVYSNKTVDIADKTYVSQWVHVNCLKPFYETMLWQQEPRPPPLNGHMIWENGTGNPYKAKLLAKKRKKALLSVKSTKAPLAPLATRITTNLTGKRAMTAAKKFQLTNQIDTLHRDT
jgi:hypothetical protein